MQKNRTPQDLELTQRYFVAWLVAIGTDNYKGIIKAEMLWKYWELFTFLVKNGNNITEALITELMKFENWMNLFESRWTYYPADLIEPARKLFLNYVEDKWEKGVTHLEEVKKVLARLDYLKTWETKTNILDIFTNIEKEIAIAKTKWDAPLWYLTGIDTIDKECEWLQPWTVMCINAYSNTWKSKLSYFITNKLLKQWLKIIYFSLEVTKEKVGLNLLANWYSVEYKSLAKWRTAIDMDEYYNVCEKQLEIIDNEYEMTEIKRRVELSKPDAIVIDFVQNIGYRWTANEYERMTLIAREIQTMAVSNNVAVLDLSQVSNEWFNYKTGWLIPSKWSGALVHSSDVALMMHKPDSTWSNHNEIALTIAKNKFGRKDLTTYLKVDFSKWQFIDKWITEII